MFVEVTWGWIHYNIQGCRDKAKLKWWYKVASMTEHRYSRKLFVQEWNVKPRRGRQRKYWCKVVDNLFSSLGLDTGPHCLTPVGEEGHSGEKGSSEL